MFTITEAEAAAIRAAFDQGGEIGGEVFNGDSSGWH